MGICEVGGLRVMIAAGGTGGHIYPGITVGQVLQREGAEVVFVGTKQGLEADVVPRAGFALRTISSRSIPRKLSPEIAVSLSVAAKGAFEAAKHIRQFRPHVVVGTGGYVSGPVVLMAAAMRYPTLIHEQNAFPGVTNRLLSRVVDKVALGYVEGARYFPADKSVFTGNPVRPEILTCTRAQGVKALGLHPRRRTLVITAGSQGARSINRALLEAAPLFNARQDLQVIHAAGRALFAEVAAELANRGVRREGAAEQIIYGNIRVVPYIYAMPEALAAADLVVGRGGALSSAEFMVRGLPAILVPYPYAAENHQVHNARVLEARGAARVLLDHEVSGETLGKLVLELLDDAATMAAMARASRQAGKPGATQALVALIEELARTR